ncbi:MAG: helix-turn-helix transcriptional regulator [Planctomycetaceae bacterium]|nr:helix-turn-helix transcriptional regulator [Planctomycetaceae bacterium]
MLSNIAAAFRHKNVPNGKKQLDLRPFQDEYSRTGQKHAFRRSVATKNPERDICMTRINAPQELGQVIRQRRKQAGLTLKEAAAMSGVGVRFLSELERGKPTLQLGLVIHVLQLFGLELHVEQRGTSNV